jgi:hypothetical protein
LGDSSTKAFKSFRGVQNESLFSRKETISYYVANIFMIFRRLELLILHEGNMIHTCHQWKACLLVLLALSFLPIKDCWGMEDNLTPEIKPAGFLKRL